MALYTPQFKATRYLLDLKAMRQTNLDTHGQRQIRRTEEFHSTWTCNRCSYHNTDPASTRCVMCEGARG